MKATKRMAEKPCPSCGRSYVSWGQHRRQWGCQHPPTVLLPTPLVAEQPRADLTSELGYKKLRRTLGKELATMHLHKKIQVSACVMAVQLAEKAVEITVELCRRAVSSTGAGELDTAISTVSERVAAVLRELRNIDKVCEVEAPDALMPVTRPLLSPPDASKKQFAFFSLIHEIADVVQKDAESRRYIEASSAEWSTGKFRTPPRMMTDIVHAQRFRDSPASRPATALELAGPKRWRIVIQPWNDDATVSTLPASPCLPPLPRTPSHGAQPAVARLAYPTLFSLNCLLLLDSGSSASAYAVSSTSTA